MDGSSGQANFKQKFKNKASNSSIGYSSFQKDSTSESDESVFLVCLVPLKMVHNNKIVWKNERPCSIKYCRPIQFEFTKEKEQNTKELYEFYEKKITELISYNVQLFGLTFIVKYEMKCTMIDGKVCNVLTEQRSSCSCNICNVTPKYINNIEYVVNLPTKDEYFRFGLHPLHCRIRFLEHLWHVACTNDFKEYKVSKDSLNYIVKLARKFMMQDAFKKDLVLGIDFVKRGYGTTNDGKIKLWN